MFCGYLYKRVFGCVPQAMESRDADVRRMDYRDDRGQRRQDDVVDDVSDRGRRGKIRAKKQVDENFR